MKSAGRVLGVDFGTVRIGLAISDADRVIASPLATYTRRNQALDEAFFRQLASEENVKALVIGLPVHGDGREGQKAAEARTFGAWLGGILDLTPAYFDERYTTVMAESALWQAGLTHKKRKQRRDRVAAQLLLQAYLEAGCPLEAAPGPLNG